MITLSLRVTSFFLRSWAWNHTQPFAIQAPSEVTSPQTVARFTFDSVQHHSSWDLMLYLPAGCIISSWEGDVKMNLPDTPVGDLYADTCYLLKGFSEHRTQYIVVVAQGQADKARTSNTSWNFILDEN